jgi:hypothetical protein
MEANTIETALHFATRSILQVFKSVNRSFEYLLQKWGKNAQYYFTFVCLDGPLDEWAQKSIGGAGVV